MLDDIDDQLVITDEQVADSTTNRLSTLIVDNTVPNFSGALKCIATWTEPEEFTIEQELAVSAKGAYMAAYSFTEDGNGPMKCFAWGSEAPTFTWKDSEGNPIAAEENKVN